MSNYNADVIVVGAGPAGSTAAYFLARAGVDVLLVEKNHFPRDKACGDSVAPGAVEVLERMGLLDWVEQQGYVRQTGLFLSSPNLTSVRIFPTRTARLPAYLIPRLELDERLAQQAVSAGARLLEGTLVERLARMGPNEVRLFARRAGQMLELTCRLVLAADGPHQSFTRSLGMVFSPPDAVAVRRYYEGVEGEPGLLELHWEKSVLPAYGFIFHMGNGRANVGTGMFARDFHRLKPNLHELLDRFANNNPYARKSLQNARPLGRATGMPFRDDAERIHPVADNVLLVGEAAGVGHPMSGEGIGSAMRSAELAAQTALDALQQGDVSARGLSDYARRFHAEFDAWHQSALLARSLLTYPSAVNMAIRAAARRHEVATLLHDILLGLVSPAEMLKPGVALQVLLAGTVL
ncbi:MAG: NAD(P)/FAD-dependent oxidoreductase [Anaerolineales bacterium]|nr:NAD(P)/FAD-dependent oxidoreductase [Anaerolineales bacterium]